LCNREADRKVAEMKQQMKEQYDAKLEAQDRKVEEMKLQMKQQMQQQCDAKLEAQERKVDEMKQQMKQQMQQQCDAKLEAQAKDYESKLTQLKEQAAIEKGNAADQRLRDMKSVDMWRAKNTQLKEKIDLLNQVRTCDLEKQAG
jgi:hypothetical protein